MLIDDETRGRRQPGAGGAQPRLPARGRDRRRRAGGGGRAVDLFRALRDAAAEGRDGRRRGRWSAVVIDCLLLAMLAALSCADAGGCRLSRRLPGQRRRRAVAARRAGEAAEPKQRKQPKETQPAPDERSTRRPRAGTAAVRFIWKQHPSLRVGIGLPPRLPGEVPGRRPRSYPTALAELDDRGSCIAIASGSRGTSSSTSSSKSSAS